MSGYPNQPPSYGYGYGAPPPPHPYGAPQPPQSYGAPPPAQPYSAAPYAQPSAPYNKPPKNESHSHSGGSGGSLGPKEFTSLFYSLQNWRSIFERFDKDRSGKIDYTELRDALLSLGYAVSPVVLDLLVSKFDKTGGKSKAIEYDNFIECCLTVKGLTDKFKEKDTAILGLQPSPMNRLC
ncbi:LOW QUALITY PROTEIN: calcium-binding protein CBP [Glycine max]|uniref:LOW QUALITY PROTEIN: calcium-binding protein CBP n=1 Tax=Glycine max TaxID=3847 RepID=UPI001B357AE9|nr:LOW QUALITY PROTEIN: calcium-binding protein CBP [Glycine max]